MTDELPLDLSFTCLADRRRKSRLMYYEIFLWKMRHAPENVNRFCDPSLDAVERKVLIKWIRSLDDRTSCQSLQILFSFSVPSSLALDRIAALGMPIISAGAGTGYWEYLLQERGVDVIAFDQNTVFPPEMRYTEIQTGEPATLTNFKERILMVSWPDHEEECTFSRECLGHYQGNTVIHIGELLGETCSANPWGQTSSRDFQLKLVEQFRCVCRVELPNWPGHLDSLTIWSRVSSSQDCDGADMKFVHIKLPRYFGWKESIAT